MPQPPSQLGSVLSQGHPWSIPITLPPSHTATPILGTKTNSPAISGSSAMMKQMSQPCWPESVLASPDLLLCSSQSTGLPPEQINVSSQISDTPEIHGMTLKYSDDKVTDEEIRE